MGIDCRKIDDFGIGTYIRGLLTAMAGVEYVAFGPHDLDLPAGIEHVIVDAPKYSIRELFRVGRGVKIDLFHAPHYVVPFVDVPFVVTIHDLIAAGSSRSAKRYVVKSLPNSDTWKKSP
ncbi:MAG: hypothetical protein DMF59_04485 [Acidobacteria bacterium]|nr:MAG: hypothetical protein DMF59_04485 [Acidobacteriota bacterium]